MSLQERLLPILKKYSFIHIDTLGELSILVPLTGARTVSNNFTADIDKPVSLYLFGDNTCKSDLERNNFFRRGENSFNPLFSALIRELESVQIEAEFTDQYLVKTLITQLKTHKEEALKFVSGNPGLTIMTNDLQQNNSLFTSKGEFIVAEAPDTARYFNLPNIVQLNDGYNADSRLVQPAHINTYLRSLNQIQKAQSENGILAAVTKIVDRDDSRAILASNPGAILEKIYQELQQTYPFLKDLEPFVLAAWVENLSYVMDPDEDLNTWSNHYIINALQSVFNNARIIDEDQLAPMTRFAQTYHHAVSLFEKNNPSEEKLNTYKLFNLQSFIYLCAVQIRLRNPDNAKQFLALIADETTLAQMITSLCTDENQFIELLQTQFHVSPREYQELLASSHQIALDHLEAPHFDELRTACMPLMVHNTHYLVIGSRLCWSTARITEHGNISSASQQQSNFDEHFDLYLSLGAIAAERDAIINLLREALQENSDYEEIALDSLRANSALFTDEQKQELLNSAITKQKYQCVEFLVNNGVYSTQAFLLVFNQHPINTQLIQLLLNLNNGYAQHISASSLFEADLEKALVILHYRPELLEQINEQGQTYFLVACRAGRTDIVEHLMNIGVNTLVRDPVSGLTARELAQRSDNARRLGELFEAYPNKIKEKLTLEPEYIEQYTLDPQLISRALIYGELDLAEIILSAKPELATTLGASDLINAINAQSQETIRLILRHRPDLLETMINGDLTPFIYACMQGDVAIIRCLLDVGADIFASRNNILIARNIVRELPDVKRISILAIFTGYYSRMSPGSVIYNQLFNSETVIRAIAAEDYHLANIILRQHPEFKKEIPGELLITAIRQKRVPQVLYILGENPQLLEYNDNGYTPFFWACRMENNLLMNELMDNGANIHAACALGTSHPNIITKSILESYAERLEDNFRTPNYNQRFTVNHIISAINARDLKLSELFLKHCAHLEDQLSPIDVHHIKQQRHQKDLSSDFNQLLKQIDAKCAELTGSKYRAAYYVAVSLSAAGDAFFSRQLSEETINQFKQECSHALDSAKKELGTHRGWHGYPLFIRAVLGFIAAITVIPAIVVHAVTPKGYVGTFFKIHETDSATRLNHLADELNTMQEQLQQWV